MGRILSSGLGSTPAALVSQGWLDPSAGAIGGGPLLTGGLGYPAAAVVSQGWRTGLASPSASPIVSQGIGSTGPGLLSQGWRTGVPVIPGSGLVYRLYRNDGAGGPVDYSAPWLVTANLLAWTPPLTPGTWKFAVRAYDPYTGLEEKNVDAITTIIVTSALDDVTDQPAPPVSLRAVAKAAGKITLSWQAPIYGVPASQRPTGFHVYAGAGSVSYTTPVATIAANAGIGGTYSWTSSALADGVSYRFGVRAFNATAEESNTSSVAATARATGPTAVVGLTATATYDPGT